MAKKFMDGMSDEDRNLVRMFVRTNINFYGAAYFQSKNPLFAWKVFRECRIGEYPIPDWFFEYLDTACSELLELESRKHAAKDVSTALGFYSYGQGTLVVRSAQTQKALTAYQRLMIYTKDLGLSNSDAKNRIASEMNVHRRTVNRWLKLANEFIQDSYS